MLEKCLRCDKLGISCPRQLYEMAPDELVALCNAKRKQIPGMTYDRMAEKIKLSKGTISGFFGGNHADYRLETIRPILKLLFGENSADCPCAHLEDSERAAYEAKISRLENELGRREDKIEQLREKIAHLEDTARTMQTDKEFLRGQVESKTRTARILAVALVVCALVIVLALLVDRSDPTKGFFWLEGLLRLPQGVVDHMSINS